MSSTEERCDMSSTPTSSSSSSSSPTALSRFMHGLSAGKSVCVYDDNARRLSDSSRMSYVFPPQTSNHGPIIMMQTPIQSSRKTVGGEMEGKWSAEDSPVSLSESPKLPQRRASLLC